MIWYSIYGGLFVVSTALAAALTFAARGLALRWQVLDHPGERRMQKKPVPLLGGGAIFATFALMLLLYVVLTQAGRLRGWEDGVFEFLGENAPWKLAALAAGGVVIFIVGLVDDLVTLPPERKLVGQVAAALPPVLAGIRLDVFLPDLLPHQEWVVAVLSGLVTMAWLILMMNSLNFLDNMDGLCAGVSGIAAVSFFLCVVPREEHFLCVLLAVLAGSVAGFLFHNFNPARIYMGDAGALFCGYALAMVAVLGTFYTEQTPSRIAIAAPVLALSVPLFDTLSVVYIRWSSGESIMRGDKRHFSHRLVELGMSPRQAVEFIYLVAAVAGLGAVLLPEVSTTGTLVILCQTAGLFGLIALLMRAKTRNGRDADS